MLQLFVVFRDGEAHRFTEPGWFFSDPASAELMARALRDRLASMTDIKTRAAFFGVGACALAGEDVPLSPDDALAFVEFESVQ